MNTRKSLFASKLALALVLGYVVIRAIISPGDTDYGHAPASARGNVRVQSGGSIGSADLSIEDYTGIAERNPFGSSGQRTNDDSLHPARSVSDELGLALFGTIAGSPSVARAIIKDLKTDTTALYKTGQTVGTARIESIDTDAVVLLHRGKTKILRFPSWQSDKGKKDQVVLFKADNETGAILQSDSKDEETDTRLPTKVDLAHDVLTRAVIKPFIIDDNVEGLKITGLENIESAKEFGLRNGDVIRTVNGHLLSSKQAAYQILKKARSKETISLELLRGGKTRTLSYSSK